MHKNTNTFCVFLIISLTAIIKCQDGAPKAEEKPKAGDKPQKKPETATAGPGAAAPAPSEGTGSGSPASEYLKLHNDARMKVELLEHVTWDDSLASKALTMVNDCNQPQEAFSDDFTVDHKNSKKSTPKQLFGAWLLQAKKAKNGNVSKCCDKNKTNCCRYARVISSKYRRVGCASNTCKNVTIGIKSYSNRNGTVCVYNYK